MSLHAPRGLLSQLGYKGDRSIGSTQVAAAATDGVAAQPLEAMGWRLRMKQNGPGYSPWQRNWYSTVYDVEVPISFKPYLPNTVIFNSE